MKTSDAVQFKYKTDSDERKGFSYYLPVVLSAFLVLIVLIELTNHELIERLIVQLFMNKK